MDGACRYAALGVLRLLSQLTCSPFGRPASGRNLLDVLSIPFGAYSFNEPGIQPAGVRRPLSSFLDADIFPPGGGPLRFRRDLPGLRCRLIHTSIRTAPTDTPTVLASPKILNPVWR